MRVVYIHQYFNGGKGASGMRSNNVARALVARGHEVHMISLRRSSGSDGAQGVAMIDGIHVHWIDVQYSNAMDFPARIRAFRLFAMRAARVARSLRGDIVFATSTPLTVIIPAWIASVGRGTPIVFEVRDLWPSVPIVMGALPHAWQRVLAKALERFAYRTSQHVIALSDDMRDGVLHAGTPASKVSVIPNMSDLDLFAPDPEAGRAWREQHAWLQDRPMVLYCGSFGRANGVGYLVDVAAAAREIDPEVQFVIAGGGAETELIRSAAETAGVLDETFHMIGDVPKPDVPSLHAAADICTSIFRPIPALEANSPNKFFDALAAGKPVAINVGGWQAEVVTRNECGIVMPSGDPRRAAAMLVELLRDPDELAERGVNARALAEERYSARQLSDQVVDILERVAAGDEVVAPASATSEQPRRARAPRGSR